MTNPLDLLRKHGDPLEQAILHDPHGLESILSVYSAIWAEQILPRREPAGVNLIDDEWLRIGSCHYSALVRLHHAASSRSLISSLVRDFSGDWDAIQLGTRMLQIHREVAVFWEQIGSAIENLEDCWTEAGLDAPARNGALENGYDRRTQFIHYRIVPLTSGMEPEVDLSYFDSKQTVWKRHTGKPEWITRWLEGEWVKIIAQLIDAWSRLRSDLSIRKPQPTQRIELTGEQVSGVPFAPPSGTEDFLPPSGVF